MGPCTRCGSSTTRTVPGPHPGGHHARLNCGGCGRFLKWLPAPRSEGGPVPPEVLARVHARRRPAPLRGTDAQRRFAGSLRGTLLHNLVLLCRPDLAALARCVVDASWFIANKGRTPEGLRWPAPHQMEPAAPTGTCPACGDPCYAAPACSDECADELAARFIVQDDPARRSTGWIDL